MPAQVRRRRRGISDGGDRIRRCSTVRSGPHIDATNKGLRRKTNNHSMVLRSHTANTRGVNPETSRSSKRLRRPTLPEMSDELLLEILARLPVKSLLRFKSVCKAWRANISDPSFVRMHLQHSASNYQRQPSFLVTPHLLDGTKEDDLWPTTFSNNICFYRWQKGQGSASLVYQRDFQGEFQSAYTFGHCNGLVLLPLDTSMYILNPATRDFRMLPDSPRSMLLPPFAFPPAVGFGLDPRTNKYKVARCFCRSKDDITGAYTTGMEVFTIDNDSEASWRETAADPPYPILDWQTARFVKGSLFWIIDRHILKQPPESRLLRFCLQEETFSVTMQPPCPALDHEIFILNELHGELCLTHFSESLQQIVIWMTKDGVNPQWDQRYILNLMEPFLTVGIFDSGIVLREGNRIFQYNFQSQNIEDVVSLDGLKYHKPGTHSIEYAWENLYYFNMIPYTESLVPIANARR